MLAAVDYKENCTELHAMLRTFRTLEKSTVKGSQVRKI